MNCKIERCGFFNDTYNTYFLHAYISNLKGVCKHIFCILFILSGLFHSKKRFFCLKNFLRIVLTYLSYNENPKIIRLTSLHWCHSCIINASPYSGFLAVFLYIYCACNAAIFTSLFANIEAFLLSKIGRVGAGD